MADADGIRVLYVEDDPLLSDMLAAQLREEEGIADVRVFCSPRDVAEQLNTIRVDVALVDLALGQGMPSGIDLGLTLRATHPDLPVVVLSQHRVPRVEDAVPSRERHGWSFIQKGSTMSVAQIGEVLRNAVAGYTRMEATWSEQPASDVLARLTPRQREVMTLAAAGFDARAISQQMHLSHVSVRRELSLAYKVLVPNAVEGTDLRTAAVLQYLRLGAVEQPA